MPTFVPHNLLLLPKDAAASRHRSLICRAHFSMDGASLFQVSVSNCPRPPNRDKVNASGKPLFSRGVSYVLTPLAFLIFRTRQIGIGSVLFRTLEQAWTLQLQLTGETLRDRCVLLALATVILPSLQSCLQRVVANWANKMVDAQNSRR
jgi:hypothetical protein